MRLAHLILAHSNPLQLERLVKRLIYTQTDVYIHLDGKSNIEEFIHLERLENVFFIGKRTAITWANYSMVTATLGSFEEILKKNIVYSHINLLSGQDYPLKSAAAIQKFMLANADKTFMRSRQVDIEWQESMSRFNLYSLGDYNFPLKFPIQSLINRILPKRKLPMGLKPFGFSQWMAITPVCASYVINYLKKNTAVRRFFKMTWGVDELVFQTVLLNSDLKHTIVNDHLRYIKFEKGGSRPKTLTMEDAQILVDSNQFFARKFSADTDTEILDYLDFISGNELIISNSQESIN
ncbi:beta-1,6-N-acetylglucosaminyltransferase [Pedobacter sp. L105]|uniref:beta-1,6-N-acetylglucosaminyltransferase n=1 Tax=Pedobacter sp. L105 TaxID=1641871 RepID=UPI00131C2030|nr:beta-1,6-N-acetylglucosaminyltransferase [Pedobacter sp. L105]